MPILLNEQRNIACSVRVVESRFPISVAHVGSMRIYNTRIFTLSARVAPSGTKRQIVVDASNQRLASSNNDALFSDLVICREKEPEDETN